jgi:hypothetical protein
MATVSAWHIVAFEASVPKNVVAKQANSDLRGRGAMRPAHLERLVRSGIGALLVLSIHGIFAPHPALAGCSHLVISRFDSAFNLNGLEDLIVDRSASDPAHDLAVDPPAPQSPKHPTPCSGMNCSSRAPLSDSTVSPEPRNIDHWINLSSRRAFPPRCTLNTDVEQSTAARSGFKPPVFHPPPL